MYKKKSGQEKCKPVCILEGHSNDVTSVDFAGRNLLATGSSDKTIQLFKWLPGDKFEELPHSPLTGHKYGINCIAFSPFGTKLASASTDGSTIIWNVKTGEKLCSLQSTYEDESAGVRTCAFSCNSSYLVTGGDDDSAAIWDVSTLSLLKKIGGHEATVTCVDFTPDSHYLVTGSSNGDLRLWDARYNHSQPLFIKAEVHDLGITTLNFNPTTGKDDTIFLTKKYMLATGGQDTDLHIWTLIIGSNLSLSKFGDSSNVTMNLHHSLCGHKAPLMMIKFNANGSMLASASGDKTIRLWDVEKLICLAVLEGHNRYATSCVFSGDGSLIAAGGGDRTIRIWKVYDVVKNFTNNTECSTSSFNMDAISFREHKKVTDWTIEDVCDWLKEQEMAEYTHFFRAQAINGRELISLTDEMLELKLGIDALGHRNKVLRFISKFCEEEADVSLDKTPGDFFCPITQEVMIDPVICADGFSYEREAINAWISSGKKASPMTNEKLPHLLLTPNRTLKNLIHRHKELTL